MCLNQVARLRKQNKENYQQHENQKETQNNECVFFSSIIVLPIAISFIIVYTVT